MTDPIYLADLEATQHAIDTANHPLSCSIWKSSVCSCMAQARAVIQLREKVGAE